MSKEQGALNIEIICQPEWLCLKNGKGHHSYFHYLLSIFKICVVWGQFFAFFPFPKSDLDSCFVNFASL